MILKIKTLLFTFVLLAFADAYGQTEIKSVIASQDSKGPVPFAHVFYNDPVGGNFVGTVSNIDGTFTLVVPAKADSIQITCVGFQRKTLVLNNQLQDTIYIKESITRLPEVTIKSKTAQEVLEDCIRAISENYQDAKFVNHGFYWRAIQKEGQFISLNQSFVTSFENNGTHTIQKNIWYDSTWTIGAEEHPVLPEFDSLRDQLYFDLVRTGSSIFNLSRVKEWITSFEYTDSIDENQITVVTATSVGKFQNSFRFFIDNNDSSFRRIEYVYRWPTTDILTGININRAKITSSAHDSIKYALKEIRGVTLYEKTGKKQNIKYLFNEIEYQMFVINNDLTIPVKTFQMKAINEFTVGSSQEYSYKASFPKRVKPLHPQKIIVRQDVYNESLNAVLTSSD